VKVNRLIVCYFRSMSHPIENLPAAITALEPFIRHYGYFGVGGLLLLENMGIPIPGETTLITAAVFSGIGDLNILIVVLVGILACVIGDSLSYLIGYLGGRRLIEKYGKYISLDQKKYQKAEAFFDRRGGIVVIAARFFEGLRQLNGFIAGSSSMKWPNFIVFNIIGSFIWVSMWSSVGYYSGNHIAALLKYQMYLSILFLSIAVFWVVWFLINKRKKRNA